MRPQVNEGEGKYLYIHSPFSSKSNNFFISFPMVAHFVQYLYSYLKTLTKAMFPQ